MQHACGTKYDVSGYMQRNSLTPQKGSDWRGFPIHDATLHGGVGWGRAALFEQYRRIFQFSNSPSSGYPGLIREWVRYIRRLRRTFRMAEREWGICKFISMPARDPLTSLKTRTCIKITLNNRATSTVGRSISG